MVLAKYKETPEHIVEVFTNYLDNFSYDGKQLPTVTKACEGLAISPKSINHYRIKFPEVDDIVERLEAKQEEYLIQKGLHNKVNSQFAQFLLKTKHNYNDQPPQLNQTNNFNITPELLKKALEFD